MNCVLCLCWLFLFLTPEPPTLQTAPAPWLIQIVTALLPGASSHTIIKNSTVTPSFPGIVWHQSMMVHIIIFNQQLWVTLAQDASGPPCAHYPLAYRKAKQNGSLWVRKVTCHWKLARPPFRLAPSPLGTSSSAGSLFISFADGQMGSNESRAQLVTLVRSLQTSDN